MNFEQPKQSSWQMPNLKEEWHEITRTAEAVNLPAERILAAFQSATVEDLPEAMWSELENTESFHAVQPGDVEKAKQIAVSYHRNWEAVVRGFHNHENMPAPMILVVGHKKPYLVAGNTRLMFARALGKPVKALIARIPV